MQSRVTTQEDRKANQALHFTSLFAPKVRADVGDKNKMNDEGQNGRRWKSALSLCAWCLPLGLAYAGYLNGITKLAALNALGAQILNWNDKTEGAIRLTLWLHGHRWVFGIALVLTLGAFAMPAEKRSLALVRLLVLASIAATCLYSFEQCTYLGGKLITFPEKNADIKGSPTTPPTVPPTADAAGGQ